MLWPCLAMTDVTSVDVLFRQVAEVHGGLDIAVLNAGVDAEHTRVEDSTPTRQSGRKLWR